MGKLFSNPKITVAAIVAVAILLFSFLGGAIGAGLGLGYLGGPITLIQLPAETIFTIGRYQITNTYVMFWLAGAVLLLLTWLATRNMSEVPGRMQSLFEVIYQFFIDLAESAAGGPRGRMFLPIVTSIFLIVLFSNWLGTLPGVGTIGRIESIEEYIEHKLAQELESRDGTDAIVEALHHDGFAHFAAEEDVVFDEALVAVLNEHQDDKFVVFTGDSGFGTIPMGRGEKFKVLLSDIVEIPPTGARLDARARVEIIEQIERGIVRPGHAPEGDVALEGGRAGLLVPYLRGASTDLNTTLAIALVAMASVQFWGIKALGFGAYAGKFFINPFKASPVDTFVGILEFMGEFIKVISFTFRLFGNMFAGEILLIAMGFLLPLIGIIPFLGLELFVGIIQALIFSMLTLIFGSLAIIAHSHGNEEHAEEAHN